jgi:splicing factor 3A subunit 1
MAEFRPDIFMGSDEDPNKKIQQELERQRAVERQKVIWDGHTATAQISKERAAGISMEEQMAAIQRNKTMA